MKDLLKNLKYNPPLREVSEGRRVTYGTLFNLFYLWDYLPEFIPNLFRGRNDTSKRKAYSLLEVVVSLGIIGILITMLFNVLIVTLNISFKLLTYSFVREEISNVVSLVSRDLRNADRIVSCGVEEAPNVCQIVLNGSFVSWEICGTGFCRYVTTNGTKNLEYRTSAVIQVNQITFQLDLQDSTIKNNMLMTIVAQHTNQSLNINNIYRQVSISTRNYDL